MKLRPFAGIEYRGQTLGMVAILAIVVFVSAMVIDYAEARYVKAVQTESAHSAALWSLVMYAVGAFGFVVVVNVSLWLMIPEGLGFYVGTLLAVQPRLTLARAMARYLHGSRTSD